MATMGARLLLLLLPPLLLALPARALRCHECSSDRGTCSGPTTCEAGARYCLTTWNTPPGHHTRVIKSCAYSCPGFEESLAASWAACCNAHLCNGARGLAGPSGALLLLPLLTLPTAYLDG